MSAEKSNSSGFDRRTFLAASAAGAAVAASAGSALAGNKGKARRLIGTQLGDGWVISNTESGFAGAVRISVQNEELGRELHVLVCKSEPASRPLASTGNVDFFLLNDGQEGQVKTPDSDVEIVEKLAKLFKNREDALPGYGKLLSQGERLRKFDPIDHADPVEGRV